MPSFSAQETARPPEFSLGSWRRSDRRARHGRVAQRPAPFVVAVEAFRADAPDQGVLADVEPQRSIEVRLHEKRVEEGKCPLAVGFRVGAYGRQSGQVRSE